METKIEEILLDDGRHAERHTTVADDGTETVEVYSSEKRPLILESRTVTSNVSQSPAPLPTSPSRPSRPEPLFKAQATVEQNVEDRKRKSARLTNYGLMAMLVLQIAAMLAALLLL